MADGIQNLKEDTLGKRVIPDILFAVCDVVKEITLRTVLKDNVDAVMVLDDAHHGDNVWVILDFPMCSYFPGLEFHRTMVLWASIGSYPI